MHELVLELYNLCEQELEGADGLSANELQRARERRVTLALAGYRLRKIELAKQLATYPLQLAVIGPTQSGKSSVVNWILGKPLAQASAVAGFTVHCQGFAVGNTDHQGEWAQLFFDGLERQSQQALDRQLHSEYSISDASAASNALGDVVVWDTPDFDSAGSHLYQSAVLQATASADALMLVVSKEKYADKTVWDLLRTLRQLSVPVVIVMNKVIPEYRDELRASVSEKYQRLLESDPTDKHALISNAIPPVVFLNDTTVLSQAGEPDATEIEALRRAAKKALVRNSVAELNAGVNHFMQQHWPFWTAAVVREHQMAAEWRTLVDKACDQALQRYQDEYFAKATHRETLQLAMAELLVLLELPGVAQPLIRLRSAVTWPLRKLVSATRELQSDNAENDGSEDTRSGERRLLDELGPYVLTELKLRVADHQDSEPAWSGYRGGLVAQDQALLDGYRRGLDSYEILLKVEIDRAAQALYKQLQQQPATLNSLRVARITTDAAAVVLAVKSGGLGAVDLVVAPAMLSLTSMLTEGALGQYMQTVQSKLTDYQRAEVAKVVSRTLRARLYAVALSDTTHGITPETLAAATRQLELVDV